MLSIGDSVRIGVNDYDNATGPGEIAFMGQTGTVTEYNSQYSYYEVTLDNPVDGMDVWPFYESELDVESMATWKS